MNGLIDHISCIVLCIYTSSKIECNVISGVLSEFTYAVDAEVVHNFLIIFGLSYLTLRPVIKYKFATLPSPTSQIATKNLDDASTTLYPLSLDRHQADYRAYTP